MATRTRLERRLLGFVTLALAACGSPLAPSRLPTPPRASHRAGQLRRRGGHELRHRPTVPQGAGTAAAPNASIRAGLPIHEPARAPRAGRIGESLFGRLVAVLATALLFSGCAGYYAARAARRQERALARAAQQEEERFLRCSNPQIAFEEGNNDGIEHRPMSSSWVAECPPEYQSQQYQAYTTGYQQGASYAPGVVVVAPTTSGAVRVGTRAGVVSCRSSSDCGGASMSCRSWGGTGQVCMGQGYSGDPCWFGSDCLSNHCDGVGQSRTCR